MNNHQIEHCRKVSPRIKQHALHSQAPCRQLQPQHHGKASVLPRGQSLANCVERCRFWWRPVVATAISRAVFGCELQAGAPSGCPCLMDVGAMPRLKHALTPKNHGHQSQVQERSTFINSLLRCLARLILGSGHGWEGQDTCPIQRCVPKSSRRCSAWEKLDFVKGGRDHEEGWGLQGCKQRAGFARQECSMETNLTLIADTARTENTLLAPSLMGGITPGQIARFMLCETGCTLRCSPSAPIGSPQRGDAGAGRNEHIWANV